MHIYVPAVKGLLDGSNFLSTTAHRSSLVTATLATSRAARKGTVEFQKRCFGVEFLHVHFEGVAGIAAHAAEAIRIFQRMGHLLVSDKVPWEWGVGQAKEITLNEGWERAVSEKSQEIRCYCSYRKHDRE